MRHSLQTRRLPDIRFCTPQARHLRLLDAIVRAIIVVCFVFCLFVRNLNNKQYLLKIYDSNFLIPFVSFLRISFNFVELLH